jgi:O-antigen/teichoic acid export membrane protein
VATGQERSGIASGGVRTLLFRILTAGTDFAILLVTARGLGSEGRGMYALASVAASIAVAVVGGTVASLSAEHAHRRSSLGQLHAGALILALIGGTAAAAVMVAVALVDEEYRVLLLAAAMTPFVLLSQLQIGLYTVKGELKRVNWVFLARSVVSLVVITVVVVAAPDRVWLALVAWTAAQPLVPLVTLWLQRREQRFSWRGLRPMLGRLLRRGAPVSAGNAISFLNYRIDLLVVAAILPLSDVGRYSVAIAIGETVLLLSRALVTSSLSTVAHSEPVEAARVTLRAVRHAALLLLVAGVALVPIALLIEPVFGEAFAGAALPLIILVPGIVTFGVSEILQSYFLLTLERSREYLTRFALATALNLTLALILVPVIGLEGAAVATSTSYVIGSFFLFVRFAQLSGVRRLSAYLPGREEVRDYVRLLGRFLKPISRTPADSS